MAVILDERARAAIVRRRARGKDGTIYLRLERATIRTGIPCVLAASWAPRRRPARDLILQRLAGADVLMDRRVARYMQRRDMTVSAAKLGPFEWLVVADPFAAEGLLEWERTHADVPFPHGGVLSPTPLEPFGRVKERPEVWR